MKKIICLLFFFCVSSAYSAKCKDTVSELKEEENYDPNSRERRPSDDEAPSAKDMLDPKRQVPRSRRVVVLDKNGKVVSVSEPKEPSSVFGRIIRRFKRDE